MNNLSRRQWLKRTAVAAAGTMAVPYFIPSGILAADGKPGPNERIGIGVIGLGTRGTLLADQLPEGGRIVALYDCNLPRAEKYKAQRKGNWPIYQHYKDILDRKDIDA